jgi:phosphate transport system substrate-binding protein
VTRLAYVLAGVLIAAAVVAAPRSRILVVGDATVLSFSNSVAKAFADHWEFRAPFLDVTGTGVGIGLFCAGVGYEHPDIVATTRPMSKAERQTCATRGVTKITEIEIGRDALVLVQMAGREPVDLTRPQLYAALAREVQRGTELAPNDAQRWNELDKQLPAEEIRVMGPEPNSTAESAFLRQVMSVGCQQFPFIRSLDDARRLRLCHAFRTDGRFLRAAKREDKVIDWLGDNPAAYAVMSFLKAQGFAHLVDVIAIEGTRPTPESIRSGRYPLATSFYLYVKDQHVPAIAGLQQFVYEYTSERAMGPEGFLARGGFITLDDRGRNHARDKALSLGLK